MEYTLENRERRNKSRRCNLPGNPGVVIEVIKGVECLVVAGVAGMVFAPLAAYPIYRAAVHFGRAVDSAF